MADLTLTTRATAPTTPGAGTRVLYPTSTGWSEEDSSGNISTLIVANASGNVGIGIAPSTAKLTVSSNSRALVAIAAGIIHTQGADGVAPLFLMDSYDSATQFTGRRSNLTGGNLSAVLLDQTLLNINARGYGAAAYSGGRAFIVLAAAENWTDAAQGAYISFYTTAKTTTSATEKMRIDDAGNVGIGMTPTYKLDVTGNFRCSTGFGCNGTLPQTAYVSGGAVAPGAGAFGASSAANFAALATLVANIRLALVANGILS